MKKKFKKGFTLVEMLVVVAIIGILSTILYSSYRRYINYTKVTVAQSEVLTIVQCFEAAMVNNSHSRDKNAELGPETFTSFEQLFELDLVATYNYISEIHLPDYIELSGDDQGQLKYVNTLDGIEIVYDTVQRGFVSSVLY